MVRIGRSGEMCPYVTTFVTYLLQNGEISNVMRTEKQKKIRCREGMQ